jgi:hypothetical protein
LPHFVPVLIELHFLKQSLFQFIVHDQHFIKIRVGHFADSREVTRFYISCPSSVGKKSDFPEMLT